MVQLDKDNINNKLSSWVEKFYMILVQAYTLLQDLKRDKDPKASQNFWAKEKCSEITKFFYNFL